MKFSDVIGHEEVKERLRQMVSTGRIPHALLFSGRPGLGKMQMARAFAQYLACENPSGGDSCGRCPACRQAAALNFPDIQYVFPIIKRKADKKEICDDFLPEWRSFLADYPYMPYNRWMEVVNAGNSQLTIYVTESARILHHLSLSTFSARYKVCIIWLPERMNADTSNKLLKIIEEPYPDTIFLLVSNEPGKILPTIFSRTQQINFRPLPDALVSSFLETEKGLDSAGATAVARLAEGSPGRALESVDSHVEAAEFRNLFQDIMRSAYARKMTDLKKQSETVAAMGRDKAARFLSYTGAMLRENFVYNLHRPELTMLSEPEEAFSARFSPFVNSANIRQMSQAVGEAREDILRNANSKIVCFDLLLTIMMNIRKK